MPRARPYVTTMTMTNTTNPSATGCAWVARAARADVQHLDGVVVQAVGMNVPDAADVCVWLPCRSNASGLSWGAAATAKVHHAPHSAGLRSTRNRAAERGWRTPGGRTPLLRWWGPGLTC